MRKQPRIARLAVLVALACIFAPSLAARAGEAEFFPFHDWDPFFVKALTGTVRNLPPDWRARYTVPVPPADRRTLAAELSELKQLAQKRTGREARIEAQREGTVEPFLEATGCGGDAKQELIKLIDDIQVDAVIAVMHFKLKFSRLRPSQVDPSLTVLFPPPGHPAYPSGHATQAYASAAILMELAPRLRHQMEKVADDIAVNREIAGVHYRSDTVGGKILALQIAEDYRRAIDMDFYRDLIGGCR